LANLSPPIYPVFVEVFLHIGQIRFHRRQFILDRDVEYGPPEGQALSTTLGISSGRGRGMRRNMPEGSIVVLKRSRKKVGG
jgi:hypothetical protein